MEGYKVIKDFSFAEKGDVFTKVEDLNLWELQKSEVVSDTETYTSMAFDSSTMEELANKDYVIWYSEEAETVYHNLNKVLNSIKDLLDE